MGSIRSQLYRHFNLIGRVHPGVRSLHQAINRKPSFPENIEQVRFLGGKNQERSLVGSNDPNGESKDRKVFHPFILRDAKLPRHFCEVLIYSVHRNLPSEKTAKRTKERGLHREMDASTNA